MHDWVAIVMSVFAMLFSIASVVLAVLTERRYKAARERR